MSLVIKKLFDGTKEEIMDEIKSLEVRDFSIKNQLNEMSEGYGMIFSTHPVPPLKPISYDEPYKGGTIRRVYQPWSPKYEVVAHHVFVRNSKENKFSPILPLQGL